MRSNLRRFLGNFTKIMSVIKGVDGNDEVTYFWTNRSLYCWCVEILDWI
ncbi:MAG: hypothetical protein LW814_01670 [Anabaena sp. CoA2_C59]|nr:hypothetical protein [Aphanizomenon flos-aquae Clear-A1]MBD2631902.1 hypothetical protein [Aphanizomenon sp. FACHB-1399]MCE2903730.1 hypothetical protein [Anabaena sp. CoA2_C59]